MNTRLEELQPYPFERLHGLLDGVTPAAVAPIRLSIGEPQHPTPEFILEALAANLGAVSRYPLTAGSSRLREAIAGWFGRRFQLNRIDAATQVLPVNGSREALFAFAQCVVDNKYPDALVACPNPFYQIYEGAAVLAGAGLAFLNQLAADDFALDLESLPPSEWARVQLLYVCSPGNPSGRVLRLDEWASLFELADRHGLIIASDECYSEIYGDEARPPLGVLEAATRLGRSNYRRIVAFTSLSKRSNLPGLRSGAVAGDAALIERFLRYRTYHGCAMSPAVQEASIAAWNDETHVRVNRGLYREKFAALMPMLKGTLDVALPQAGFYLWAGLPEAWRGDDERFARDLVQRANVTVLPGTYLARHAHGINPGRGRVRIALVPPLDECVEAARRMIQISQHTSNSDLTHVPTSA